MIRAASLLLGIALFIIAGAVTAQAEQRAVTYAPGGIAISGYDAVAYFTAGRAVRGSAEYAIMWRGATWYFASPESLMVFEMDPEAYAPQFGGYCAYAVAEGQTGSAAPDAYFFYNDRLYFMHDLSMLRKMKSQLPEIVAEAEAHWPEALGQ